METKPGLGGLGVRAKSGSQRCRFASVFPCFVLGLEALGSDYCFVAAWTLLARIFRWTVNLNR